MRAAVLAWCASLVVAVAAHAEVPSGARDRLNAAIARFEALARKTQAEDRLPQLSRPDEKPVLEALWDITILGRPPYAENDLDALDAMGAAADRIATIYVGGAPPSDEDRFLLRIPPIVQDHVEKYPDEITRAGAFEFQIAVDRLSAVAEQWTHLEPGPRKTLEADVMPLRDAINRKMFGVPGLLTDPIMSDGSRTVWADALARNATAIADVTPLLAREFLLPDLKSALPKVAEPLRPKLEALIAAMSTRPCIGLCLVMILPPQTQNP